MPHIPEEDKHITEILAEQLAEQHIPLNLPLHFLPAQEHDQFQPSQQIDPALSQPTLFMQQPSAVQSTDKSFYQPALLQHCPKSAESQHLEGFSIQSTVPGKTESDNHTQHAWQEALPAFQRPGHVLHQALTDLALSAVTASRAESQGVSHQSAEMLQVTNSRVHTWLGLALRQAFLRPDQLHRENEASVQVRLFTVLMLCGCWACTTSAALSPGNVKAVLML